MAINLIEKVTQSFPDLSYRVVDLAESPELGLKYGVITTPAIAINGKLVFSGIPKEKKLRKKLEKVSRKRGE